MPKIKILQVQCTLPDETDKDEMYLKYNGKKIWPAGELYFRMDEGEKVHVDFDLEVASGWIDIELWDFDFLSANDHLGTFKFNVDAPSGKYSTSMELDEVNSPASYLMTWEILD